MTDRVRTLIVGCGYLGVRVGRLLVARGERVVGTVRSEGRAESLARDGIEPILADVLHPESLAALPDADRVLHCVGFDRSAGVGLRAVYVDGLGAVLDRLKGRCGRFVHVSSTGVYGQNDGGWVDEDSPTEPTHESGRVVLDAERLVRAASARSGLATVVLRPSGLYGPGRIIRRESVLRGEAIAGDPDRFLNLIAIDDAATAALAALDRAAPGSTYHLSDDRPIPRRAFYDLLADCLGVPPPRFVAPVPGSPEARREDSNKRVSNRRMREELGVQLAYPDITSGLPAALRAEAEA